MKYSMHKRISQVIKGNWGKENTPKNIICKYDAEVGIRVKKMFSCPMNTICLIQLWGLGPKPEQGDLCHPYCAWQKFTGQLVDKMQL